MRHVLGVVRNGGRTARRMLAVLILGSSIAFSGAAAFAGQGDNNDNNYYNRPKFPQAIVQAEPATAGAVAGPSTELPVWVQMRYDNFGH